MKTSSNKHSDEAFIISQDATLCLNKCTGSSEKRILVHKYQILFLYFV